MEDFQFTSLPGDEYAMLITFLTYETTISNLRDIQFVPPVWSTSRKVLIDAGVKVGLNRYRFYVRRLDANGYLTKTVERCTQPSAEILEIANGVLREHRDRIIDNAVVESAWWPFLYPELSREQRMNGT